MVSVGGGTKGKVLNGARTLWKKKEKVFRHKEGATDI